MVIQLDPNTVAKSPLNVAALATDGMVVKVAIARPVKTVKFFIDIFLVKPCLSPKVESRPIKSYGF